MITINNLEKSFNKNRVLKGINLNISEQGIFAVLGPNGSGKTTLIKCILGMVVRDSGSVLFHGKEIKNQFLYRKDIGYLPQIARFPNNLKTKELITMVKDIKEVEADETFLIEEFELSPFMNKPLRFLSGGTLQKVNLLVTFMFDCPTIILDEPTSGLDPVAMLSLKKLIAAEKKKGKIILITSHVMNFVEEIADEVIFLLEGKIYFRGTVSELKGNYNEDNMESAIAKILVRQNHD